MVIVIACILLAAIIGGGIYVWVIRARKSLLAKKTRLAESSKILDEAQTSVLDSVVSPVSQSATSSTASDHPQINASPETANGEVGAQADKTGEAAVKLPEPASDSRYAARFRQVAPTIKELAEKLLVAWNEASKVVRAEKEAWDKVTKVRNCLYLGNDCSFIQDPADLSKFLADLNQHFNDQICQYKTWLELSAKVDPSAQAASQAHEALRLALKPFPREDSHRLPPDLEVICAAAQLVLDTSRNSIEKKLKTGLEVVKKVEKEEPAGQPIKHDRARLLFVSDQASFAEGTHEDDIKDTHEARQSLLAAARSAIQERFSSSTAQAALEEIFNKLERLDKQSFTFPKKPTPEEITRFLAEVEAWSKEKLETERQVAPLFDAASKAVKQVKDGLQHLKRTRGRTTPVLSDAARTFDEGLVLAINKVVSDLETYLADTNSKLAKLAEKKPKVSDPQSKVDSQEEASINVLRASMRTVSFALAQRSVAATKLADIQRKQPQVNNWWPHVERAEAFEKLLARYTDRYQDRARQEAEHARWEEVRDLIQMAYDARKNKVTETSAALGTKLAEVNKTLGPQPADELLIVGGMSARIVGLTSN